MAEQTKDCFKEEFKRYKKKSTDLTEVLDLRNPEKFKMGVKLVPVPVGSPPENCRAETFGLKPPSEWRVLSCAGFPGLLLLPDLFQRGSQHHWVRRCLVDYPCKPNISNLDAHMERCGHGCLWPHEDSPSEQDTTCTSPQPKKTRFATCTCTNNIRLSSVKEGGASVIPKNSALYRLRWVTLGYHYDWNTKTYSSVNRSVFPADLAELSSFILHCAGYPGFQAEAAIVNYYHLDSSLSGHTDHSEKDLTQPLLSISFGQSAIFLIGGKSKEVKPIAILLRSGDVVIMSSEARLAYHGVPRVLPPSQVGCVPAPLSVEAIIHGLSCRNEEGGQEFCAHCRELISAWPNFISYLSVSRINVNIRQVVSEDHTF